MHTIHIDSFAACLLVAAKSQLFGGIADLAAKKPHDPMSFPPGLIPQLVREKNVTDPPYSPLSPLDIEALGLPPSAAPDAYLASRLEKFYAELQVSQTLIPVQSAHHTACM